MARLSWAAAWWGLVLAGCAGSKMAAKTQKPETQEASAQVDKAKAGAPAADPKMAAKDRGTTFVDRENGFSIARPRESWAFRPGEELNTENIVVPVIIADSVSGAQVVVQVAPAVASPSQFAERLTTGLQSRVGFSTGDVRPIPQFEGAVGFDFQVGQQVHGRVAIHEGAGGRVYVLLATWPRSAPDSVEQDIDRILGSIKTSVE